MRLTRFAQATAFATYVLLVVGSLVHGTGSSLACPDWPLCHGTAFPEMKHGVEFEHTHRLVAAAVAIMTTVLGVLVVREPRYRRLRALAIAAPIMVFAQALLGGLTVLLRLPRAVTLSHLTLSMCFFSVLLVLALRIARIDRAAPAASEVSAGVHLAPVRVAVGVAVVAVLVQVFLGGLVRHSMAGLACITFPLCFGNAWPPESSSEQIHMLHRYGATLVTLLVVPTAIVLLRRSRSYPHLRAAAIAALVLVALQVTLGVLSVTSLLHLPVVTTHLAVGALLLGTLVSTWGWLDPEALAERRVPAAARVAPIDHEVLA